MPNGVRISRNMYTSDNLNGDQDIVLVHMLLTPEEWEPYKLACRMAKQCGANQRANRIPPARGMFGCVQACKERDSRPIVHLNAPFRYISFGCVSSPALLEHTKGGLRVGATMLHQIASHHNFTLYARIREIPKLHST